MGTKNASASWPLLDVVTHVCLEPNEARAKSMLVSRGGVWILAQWVVHSLASSMSPRGPMAAVMGLLVVLLRSADVSDSCREGSQIEPRGENPFRHVRPVASIDPESVNAILSTRPLMYFVSESHEGMPFLLDLLSFLSRENEAASRRILAVAAARRRRRRR